MRTGNESILASELHGDVLKQGVESPRARRDRAGISGVREPRFRSCSSNLCASLKTCFNSSYEPTEAGAPDVNAAPGSEVVEGMADALSDEWSGLKCIPT